MTKAEKKQLRYDTAYMRMAMEWAKLSHCKRKQVGSLIVKDRMIISDGYNGTPSGFENICEDLFRKTMDPVEQVLKDSKIAKNDVCLLYTSDAADE